MLLSVTACMIFATNAVFAATVQTTHGPIEGTTFTLFNNKTVDAFLGVPYAAPPIGRNRFAPPQPLASWTQTLPTKKLSQGCLQSVTEQMRNTMWYVSEEPESEDCLYLNVWRPQAMEEKMPVMIWIHGGGFVGGSSIMPLYNASILASENDVIVASINYRLGQFGFLFLNDSLTPGNAGLDDQIQAIKWIRDNVEAFGGDSDRITLFGQSAGSVSASLHLVNKDVIPLFNNAILQSAALTAPIGSCSKFDALQNSLDFAKIVGCPVENMNDTLNCLTNKDIVVFKNSSTGLLGPRGLAHCPVRNNIQVPIDISNVAQNVPRSQRKNIMGGTVPRELSFIVTDFFPGKTFDENMTISVTEMMQVWKYLFQLQDERLLSVLLHEYKSFDARFNPNQVRLEAISSLSDFNILCTQISFMKDWVTDTNQVYYYEFDHRPSKQVKFLIPNWVGIIHGDDIPFVFGTPMDPKNGYSDNDTKISKTMMTYWTNFAKTGNPNGNNSQGTVWTAIDPNANVIQTKIQESAKTEPFQRGRQCDFWWNIYPNLFSVQGQLQKGA